MRWPLSRYLPEHSHINFVRLSPFAAILSVLAVIGSIACFAVLGLNLGIDFKGGTVIEVVSPGPAPQGQYRAALAKMGLRDAGVQGFRRRQRRGT